MPKDGPTHYILSVTSTSQFKIIFKGHETITAVCAFSDNTLLFTIETGSIVFESKEPKIPNNILQDGEMKIGFKNSWKNLKTFLIRPLIL